MSKNSFSGVLLIVLALVTVGCAERRHPIDPGQIDEPDEIPPGPGLFSGEDGVFDFNF